MLGYICYIHEGTKYPLGMVATITIISRRKNASKGSDINYGRGGAKKLGESYPHNFVIPPIERTPHFVMPPPILPPPQAALMLDSGRSNLQANTDKIQHLL